MRQYKIIVTMPDGSRGQAVGNFLDGTAACIAYMDAFPEAMRVSALRLL